MWERWKGSSEHREPFSKRCVRWSRLNTREGKLLIEGVLCRRVGIFLALHSAFGARDAGWKYPVDGVWKRWWPVAPRL